MVAASRMQRRLSALIVLVTSAECFSSPLCGLRRIPCRGSWRGHALSTPLTMAKKATKSKSKASKPAARRGFGASPTKIGNVDLVNDPESLNFMAWLQEGGASIGKVALATNLRGVPGLRGMVATQTIEAGEAIVSIPRDLCIYLGSDAENPGFAGAELARIKNDPGRAAKFQPYLTVLPKGDGLDNTIFFPPEDLALCEWAPVIGETEEKMQQLRATLEGLNKNVGRARGAIDSAGAAGPGPMDGPQDGHTSQVMSWDDFAWGVYQVESRVFTIFEEGMGRKFACPVIDMMNHDGKSTNVLKPTRDGWVQVIAGKRLRPGQELCIVYADGAANMDKILVEYGFVDEGNENDVAQLITKTTLSGQTGLGLDLAGVRAALDGFSTTDDEDLAQLREASSRFAATAIRFRIAKKKSLRRALQQLETA